MNVIEILMKRDGLSESEAFELVQETREELLSADPWEADEIISCNLGLEPDYLMNILMI